MTALPARRPMAKARRTSSGEWGAIVASVSQPCRTRSASVRNRCSVDRSPIRPIRRTASSFPCGVEPVRPTDRPESTSDDESHACEHACGYWAERYASRRIPLVALREHGIRRGPAFTSSQRPGAHARRGGEHSNGRGIIRLATTLCRVSQPRAPSRPPKSGPDLGHHPIAFGTSAHEKGLLGSPLHTKNVDKRTRCPEGPGHGGDPNWHQDKRFSTDVDSVVDSIGC